MEDKHLKVIKFNERLKEHFGTISEYFNYKNRLEEVTYIHALIYYGFTEYEYWYDRCRFVLSEDNKEIECLQDGIPAQIIYQNYYNEESMFLKFPLKKLKSVCKYITSKLNVAMDETIFETYKKYENLVVKFDINYLEATSFKYALDYARAKKKHYINYLEFMKATGLFEEELNNIDKIHAEMDEMVKRRRFENERYRNIYEIEDRIIKYLNEKYNIVAKREDEGIDIDVDYILFEEISDDYENYIIAAEENPNQYSVYKWCIEESESKLFMSKIPLSTDMIIEEYILSTIKNTSLEENMVNIERYISTPLEYVMSLEEFIKNRFKVR